MHTNQAKKAERLVIAKADQIRTASGHPQRFCGTGVQTSVKRNNRAEANRKALREW